MKYAYETTDAIYEIPVDEIHASDEFNCRDTFTAQSVKSLVDSIQEIGKLIEPIIIQPMSDVGQSESVDGKKWQVVAGHRRFRAVQLLAWLTISCRVVEELTSLDAARLNLLENIEREDLNIMEEANALDKVWGGVDDKIVSKLIKRPTKWVQIRRQLIEFPEEIQQAAASGRMSQYDIEFVGRVEPHRRLKVFNQILAKKAGKNVSAPSVNGRVYKKTKRRTNQEVTQMMVHIMELSQVLNWDCSEVASTLAWVLGNISARELLDERLPLHHDESLFDD